MSDFDTFDKVNLTPGVETLIWTPGGRAIIGVVATVDDEAQSVTFADGRAYTFPAPEPEEVEP
jgi:D-lyxose ketol-isomerase